MASESMDYGHQTLSSFHPQRRSVVAKVNQVIPTRFSVDSENPLKVVYPNLKHKLPMFE
jgi:hypothetical protein